jgi:small GTP-binding protein
MSAISKKICMVGDFGVGKTSLIRRFVERQFNDKYLSTVGVKISRKAVELTDIKQQDKLNVQLLIWDIEGHTKFKAIAPTYLQGAAGAVIVGDFSRQETLERIPEHIQLFLSVNPKGFIVIALNKADLVDQEKVEKLFSTYQFDDYERVIQTYPTSAKTGNYVDELFEKLTYRIVESA